MAVGSKKLVDPIRYPSEPPVVGNPSTEEPGGVEFERKKPKRAQQPENPDKNPTREKGEVKLPPKDPKAPKEIF